MCAHVLMCTSTETVQPVNSDSSFSRSIVRYFELSSLLLAAFRNCIKHHSVYVCKSNSSMLNLDVISSGLEIGVSSIELIAFWNKTTTKNQNKDFVFFRERKHDSWKFNFLARASKTGYHRTLHFLNTVWTQFSNRSDFYYIWCFGFFLFLITICIRCREKAKNWFSYHRWPQIQIIKNRKSAR